jgi:uncharacterized damage-inducible protein DinB
MEQDLRYPIGKFERGAGPTEEQRHQWINVMAEAPERLAEAVAGLTQEQLETPHRPGGWTVLQTVHHMADSHMNSFVRCKVALTEEEPLVTSFKGAQWAELPDAKSASVDSSLAIFEGLQARWVVLLRSLAPADWARKFRHPQMGPMSLDDLLALYEWHCRHHVAHITSLRERNGWK